MRHIPHPSKAGFIQGFDGPTEPAGLGLSKQTLYNYEEHYNLPWPLLPEDETALVWVLFGQPPFHLTWVRQSVVDALDRPRERIVCAPSMELLRHGQSFDDPTLAHLRRLKSDPTFKVAVIDDVVLDVANCCTQLTRMEVRYTGEKWDRFYVCAYPLGVPLRAEADVETWNVDQNIIVEMKHEPLLSRYRLVQEQAEQRSLIAAIGRLNTNPELLREVLNRALPKYEFPGDAQT